MDRKTRNCSSRGNRPIRILDVYQVTTSAALPSSNRAARSRGGQCPSQREARAWGMMDGVTHSGEISPSPPATFPVYGLDGSWSGSRWLDGFGDRIGDEVRYVRLAHQNTQTGALIMVESCSRPLTDTRAAHSGESPLQGVAFDASVVMVNLTLPVPSVPRPPGMLRALVGNADARARLHAEWSPVSWRVGGSEVGARAWRFAGGWAAFSDSVDGVYLAAAGSAGTGPDGLALAALQDGHGYNFDLDRPLHPRVIAASSAARGGGEHPLPLRPDWHADQVRLLGAVTP
jgi:hypothetical protein